MRFERLDLNLLVALDVLIAERSVSAAAKKLHLSQPAVSGALNRLREFFRDDLLVQVGRQMVLTPKADELAYPVRDALLLIRTRITQPAGFDPATVEREFSIVASDYIFNIFLADVIAKVATLAPGVGFEIMPPEAGSTGMLERGNLDLLITPHTHVLPHHPYKGLFEDDHAVICWSEGAHGEGIDAEAFLDAGHAVASFGPDRLTAFSEGWFDRQSIARRIDVRVPSFTWLPLAVIGTNRVATMQRRYAEYYARSMAINVLPVPFAIPQLQEVIQWHSMREKDEGLQWLIELISGHAAELKIVFQAAVDGRYQVE